MPVLFCTDGAAVFCFSCLPLQDIMGVMLMDFLLLPVLGIRSRSYPRVQRHCWSLPAPAVCTDN